MVWILNLLIPHEHNSMGHHGPHFDLKKAWLFIIAITLHKLPEGLAVGVAYGAEELVNPMSLVVGIAAHNIPEGLTIAISLVAAGNSRLRAAMTAFLIGLVQPLGAIIGLFLMDISFNIVPYGMALAGGTLLFVVINEILPETYGVKETNRSAAAVFIGFILMTGPSSTETVFEPDIFSVRRIKVAPVVCFFGFIFMIYAVLRKPKTKIEE